MTFCLYLAHGPSKSRKKNQQSKYPKINHSSRFFFVSEGAKSSIHLTSMTDNSQPNLELIQSSLDQMCPGLNQENWSRQPMGPRWLARMAVTQNHRRLQFDNDRFGKTPRSPEKIKTNREFEYKLQAILAPHTPSDGIDVNSSKALSLPRMVRSGIRHLTCALTYHNKGYQNRLNRTQEQQQQQQ